MNFGKIDPVGCFDKVGGHKWSHDELPFQFMRDNVARFRNRGGDDDDDDDDSDDNERMNEQIFSRSKNWVITVFSMSWCLPTEKKISLFDLLSLPPLLSFTLSLPLSHTHTHTHAHTHTYTHTHTP